LKPWKMQIFILHYHHEINGNWLVGIFL
jgi:hypothetical protein